MGVVEAVQTGDLDALKAAIAADPKCVNDRDGQGVPALLVALYYGRKDCVHRLLDAGADVDFFTACALNRASEAGRFLDDDAGWLGRLTPDGWTGLHLAAFFGAPEVVELLLKRGADVGARSGNHMANLALHSAAAARQARIAEMLLEAGAPVDATQHGGYTAMDSARQNNDEATMEVLRRFGAR